MNSSDDRSNGEASNPDMIKVVDRKGNAKFIPRSQYEASKRHRKKHENTKNLPVKEILSVLIILASILAASYVALILVK
jgi:hypothetical protein